MDDVVLAQLMKALGRPQLRSLVLVPAEQPATTHIRPADAGGWVLTLECRRVLADLLRAVTHNGGDAASSGTCQVSHRAANSVQVEIVVPDVRLLSRLLRVLVDDHLRTRPDTRLAALMLDDGAPAPRRLEVVIPPRPRIRRGTTLVVLPALSAAHHG